MDRRTRPPEANVPASPPEAPQVESVEQQDRRLDEELAETFPASDPIPVRHDS